MGRSIGPKCPLKSKDVWTIRVRLQLEERRRDLALFNLTIDSKLRLRCATAENPRCVCRQEGAGSSEVVQKKTDGPVQVEITPSKTRYLFRGRFRAIAAISTAQYARIVHQWVECAGLNRSACGTHSLRRNEAAPIYKESGSLRAGAAAARTHETGKYGSAISGSGGRMPSPSRNRSSYRQAR